MPSKRELTIKYKSTSRRSNSKRRVGNVKRQNAFVRFLSRIPHWFLWLLGLSIAFGWIFGLLVLVMHFSMPWKARFGEVPEPDGYEVRGIDISHYQSSIDWEKLKDAKLNGQSLNFIIMKATEGTNIFDKTFNDNFHQAHVIGFKRGAYHFYIPGASATVQANYFLSQVHLVPGDLPPVLDIEKDGGLSVKKLQDDVRTWLQIVGAHYGVKPIIYTNYAFKMQYLDTPEFNAYPFWIAHYYKDKLDYKGQWTIWQYTDCGVVDGVNERVDCNVFNGKENDLENLCITEEQYPIHIED